MFSLKDTEEAYKHFSSEAFKPGALDGKTKELIGLAVSIMVDCIPCIGNHYKKAVEAGASHEEISEVLPVVMAINCGTKSAKYSILISDLAKQTA